MNDNETWMTEVDVRMKFAKNVHPEIEQREQTQLNILYQLLLLNKKLDKPMLMPTYGGPR